MYSKIISEARRAMFEDPADGGPSDKVRNIVGGTAQALTTVATGSSTAGRVAGKVGKKIAVITPLGFVLNKAGVGKNSQGVAEARKHVAPIERRCVADVMKKQGKDMSGAFAICRSSMQKAGNYKPGTADLTRKGAAKSAGKDRAKDDPAKKRFFVKQVKAARKNSSQ